MKITCVLVLVLGGALHAIPAQAAPQGDQRVLQSTPTLVLEMRDHWKRYQELDDAGDQERAEHAVRSIIELRLRAGMLGCSTLARAFAMRGWRQGQDGQLEAAVEKYRIAESLDPAAREYHVALAGALAARNPLDITAYLPQYWQAFWVSFESARGRYLLLADSSLWLGLIAFIAGSFWLVAMLLRHLRSTHHSLMEMLTLPFTFELAQLIAALALVSPLFFGVPLHWYALGLAAASWAFQNNKEKSISIAALVFLWLGAGLILLSAQMAAGLTAPDVQAAFFAEQLDADETVVGSLEKGLAGEIFDEEGHFKAPAGDNRRLELFLYAQGLRKLGQSKGIRDLDVLEMFLALRDDSTMGRLAAVNAANIQLERESFTSAQSNYETALENKESRPYALYNLWRLNDVFRSRSDAQDFLASLQAESPGFVKRFGIEGSGFQPELIDAPAPAKHLERLVNRGLADAGGGRAARRGLANLFLSNLFGIQQLWVVFVLAGMIAGYFLFGFLGVSAVCPNCGRVFCRRCHLDPAMSSSCQACAALKAPKLSSDAELLRGQRRRIGLYERWKAAGGLTANILVPGLGMVIRGRTFLGAALILCWSALAAILYGADRLPRAESLPYFTHWTFPLGLIAVLLALVAYPLAIWLTLKEKKRDGTKR